MYLLERKEERERETSIMAGDVTTKLGLNRDILGTY
jgi:hypothetical protein